MKLLKYTYAVLIAGASLMAVSHTYAQQQKPHLIFLNPGTAENPFWKVFEQGIKYAALNINMDVDIRHANNSHIVLTELATEIAQSKNKPDYVIFKAYKDRSHILTDILNQARIYTMIVNNPPSAIARARLGEPRSRYPHYLGDHTPTSESNNGYELAKFLVEQARKKGFADGNGNVRFLAVTGHTGDTVHIERFAGALRYIEEDGNVTFLQKAEAESKVDVAAKRFPKIFRRHGDIDVVWVASAGMTEGVLIVEYDKKPGRDYLLGSFDWTETILNAIQSGVIEGSMGGHFMEGAWATVLLYDHYFGYDFADEGLKKETKMSIATRETAHLLQSFLYGSGIENINFKQFSRVYNKDLSKHNMSLDVILNNLINSKITQ